MQAREDSRNACDLGRRVLITTAYYIPVFIGLENWFTSTDETLTSLLKTTDFGAKFYYENIIPVMPRY
jgi:hypothetical protein